MTARSVLPSKIRDLLISPANVAVHGSPGSGKSWIGDQVLESLQGGDNSVARVDISTTLSGKEVFLEILDFLNGSDTDLPVLPEAPIREVWRAVRASLASSNQHTILLLDQFDRVLQFDDALDFLLLFRELVHRPESLRCTALMISRRSLQLIETRVSGISTLASVCYTEYLGSLDIDDLDDLGPGAKGLATSDKVECLRWSGGHAALAKYWLTTRPDMHPDPSGDMERAKTALRVLDNLADLRLVDAAAQYVLGPIIDDYLFERQELELLGVLSPAGAAGVSVSLSDQEYFCNALRHRTWSMNPWGVLGQAEVRLRGIVELVLTDAYGDTWPSTVARKNTAVATARDAALDKQGRDMRMFSRQAPWLSYTYPGDLWLIVQVEWILFVRIFNSRDKAYWRGVMTGLSQYRAPLAHGRVEVLSENQRTQCRLFAEEVIASISQFEASRQVSVSPALLNTD